MRAHPCTCARPVRVSTCALARAAPPPAAARVRPRTPADMEAREARARTRPGMGSAHGPRLRVGHSRACPHTTHPRGFGDCSAHGESKFCFLKTSGIFFFHEYYRSAVHNAKPTDMQGRLSMRARGVHLCARTWVCVHLRACSWVCVCVKEHERMLRANVYVP